MPEHNRVAADDQAQGIVAVRAEATLGAARPRVKAQATNIKRRLGRMDRPYDSKRKPI